MPGFLDALIPFSEVGGSAIAQAAQQQGALERQQRQQRALSALIQQTNPESAATLGPAIESGVDPGTALSLVDAAQKRKTQQDIFGQVSANGGKWTPELAARAVTAGLIPAAALGPLIKAGGGNVAPDGLAAVQMLDGLIAQQTDPNKKAELESMRPAALENGTIVFKRFTGLASAMGEGKPSISWRTTMDTATGNEIQVPYRYDAASGTEVPVGVAGGELRGKLGQNQQKQLDAVNNVQAQMSHLREAVSELPEATPGTLATEYAKYRAPFGIGGAVDPRYGNYFNALGQIQTDLVQAAMGSSRAYQLVHDLKPHIPTPFDPPARALEKLNGFDEGRFAAVKRNLLGSSGAPDTSGPAAAFPPPPFANPEVRMGADGNYLARDPVTGKIYNLDTTSNAWLPTR